MSRKKKKSKGEMLIDKLHDALMWNAKLSKGFKITRDNNERLHILKPKTARLEICPDYSDTRYCTYLWKRNNCGGYISVYCTSLDCNGESLYNVMQYIRTKLKKMRPVKKTQTKHERDHKNRDELIQNLIIRDLVAEYDGAKMRKYATSKIKRRSSADEASASLDWLVIVANSQRATIKCGTRVVWQEKFDHVNPNFDPSDLVKRVIKFDKEYEKLANRARKAVKKK